MGILRADRITGLGGANAIKGSVFFGTFGTATYGNQIEIQKDAELDIGNGNLTVECWFNSPYTSGYQSILGQEFYNNFTSNKVSFNFYLNNDGIYLWNRESGSANEKFGVTGLWKANTWNHLAWVREGTGSNENKIYVNGSLVGSAFTNDVTYSSEQKYHIGGNFYSQVSYGQYPYKGYISNLRMSNTARYTANFTPPTFEFTVDSDTILLTCQSPSNILKEETGKTLSHNTLANNTPAQASRFTPNTPIIGTTSGFSTTTDVGSQYGSTFDGFGNFASSTYMVPTGGNSAERNRGRALYAGGYKTPNTITAIDSIEIQSGGLTEKFGDLSGTAQANCSACSSSTRMVTNGGWTGSANNNVMEFVTIANSSNSTDFGDLAVGRRNNISASNQTRGLVYGGNGTPANTAQVDFFTIATAGNAADFGDASSSTALMPAGGSSTTRALFAGGYTPSASDTIDYFTIASTGNATDFGNLVSARKNIGGLSSSTRTLFCGGGYPSAVNSIDYVTTATTGNAQDFGDLTLARGIAHGTSNQTRGIFMGGSTNPARQNTIDFVIIAVTSDAIDFGDLRTEKQNGGVASDSHGGL